MTWVSGGAGSWGARQGCYPHLWSAYVHVSAGRRLSEQGCVSVCQFHFAWLSMRSDVLLCYWFLCEYFCIPHFCLIKWQSTLSRQTRSVNSMCVGTCTETCEHVSCYTCILIKTHSLHQYKRVCTQVTMSARTDVFLGQFHFLLLDYVCVSTCSKVLLILCNHARFRYCLLLPAMSFVWSLVEFETLWIFKVAIWTRDRCTKINKSPPVSNGVRASSFEIWTVNLAMVSELHPLRFEL